jgi:hypothetical protein
MSLASVYAASQASAAAGQVTANEAVPPPFIGPNGRAEVTASGGMRLVPNSTGLMEVPAASALAMAAWITATFG